MVPPILVARIDSLSVPTPPTSTTRSTPWPVACRASFPHSGVGLEARYSRTDAFHHARTIGQRHQRKFLPRAIAALDRQEIAIVDRRRLELDKHLAGTGNRRGLLNQHHGIDPTGALQLIGFQ